ncbi:MAG: GCN5-related N-acetyltransferase [Frankiales bacterium]|nr:GCN5-related N-acetyltransferase [Frankiales bacterium]
MRTANEAWLSPWEGRPPGSADASWPDRHSPAVYTAMLRVLRREAKAGRSLPCAVLYRDRLVGQVTVGSVTRGAFDSGYVGYWVDGRLAGRGIAPTAVALLVDHCFDAVGLHRVEANVRPENAASLRVVEKLGFTREALHRRYLHIDGDWRDHVGFALLREDVPEGVLRRYRSNHAV